MNTLKDPGRFLGSVMIVGALLTLSDYRAPDSWASFLVRSSLGVVFLLGLDLVIESQKGRD